MCPTTATGSIRYDEPEPGIIGVKVEQRRIAGLPGAGVEVLLQPAQSRIDVADRPER